MQDVPDQDTAGPSPRAGCAIAVMAKAPRAGRVKTRLVPPLTPEQAMQMSAAFLRDITENLRLAGSLCRDGVGLAPWVAFAPAGGEAGFAGMLAEGTRLLLADGTPEMPPGVEGFGRSLLHAAQGLFAEGYGSVCLLNADSPTLPTTLLVEAAGLLAAPGERVVLGAAEDGGYYLIGMQAPLAGLFADIAWSTETVAEQTRARVAALGLPLVELAPWYDVDDRVALARLVHEAAHGAPGPLTPYAAPATAACVAGLGLAGLLAGAG